MPVTIDGTSGVNTPSLTTSGSTVPVNGLYLPTTNTLGLATNSVERVRIDASGNLGIGATSPAYKLDVNISSGSVRIRSNTGTANSAGYLLGNSYRSWSILSESSAGNFIISDETTAGTPTRLTLDSSGNLGIGVTPAASFWTGASLLQLGAGAMVIGQPANASAVEVSTNQFINAAGSARTYLTTGAVGVYQQSSGRHRFYSAASGSAGAALTLTTVLEVDKDKTLALQGGSSTTGVGIAFPATQSASTNANTLDDYEEGTWTPALSTTSGSISFSSVTGTYTKIGRMVYVRASYNGPATISSPTGDLKLTGLPFTVALGEVGAGSTSPYSMAAGAYSINVETIANTTTCYVFNFANGTRSSAHSYIQSSSNLHVSFCYQV